MLYQIPFAVDTFFVYKEEETRDNSAVRSFIKNLKTTLTFEILDPKSKDSIREFVDPSQIQVTYGGVLEDLKEFWPPRFLGNATHTLNEDDIQNMKLIPFTYDSEVFRAFKAASLLQSSLAFKALLKSSFQS